MKFVSETLYLWLVLFDYSRLHWCTDAACYYRRGMVGVLSVIHVCPLVTTVSFAKVAEPIQRPFGMDLGGPWEPYIRWGPGSTQGEISIL